MIKCPTDLMTGGDVSENPPWVKKVDTLPPVHQVWSILHFYFLSNFSRPFRRFYQPRSDRFFQAYHSILAISAQKCFNYIAPTYRKKSLTIIRV